MPIVIDARAIDPLGAAPDAPLAAIVVDAGAIDAPAADTRPRRLAAYLALLSVDFVFYQILAKFPGAPPTNRFVSYRYDWELRYPHKLVELPPPVTAAAAMTDASPRLPVDEAVAAYAAVFAAWWPKIHGLFDYYADRGFIDDEFDRGRREAHEVADALADLERVRAPMREAVVAAWRALASDVPHSPRAVVAQSWAACIAYADQVMAHAKPEALDAAVSGCRRAIEPVAQLPSMFRSNLAPKFRKVAIDLGDAVATNQTNGIESAFALAELTEAYLHDLAGLPAEPAERNAP